MDKAFPASFVLSDETNHPRAQSALSQQPSQGLQAIQEEEDDEVRIRP